MGQISTFYPNPGPSQAEKFCKEEIRMRNLKRALSLTLASVMLLGMMVIGTSAVAGYSDVDEDDNVEAIEVLQAIEVMVGDDRGFGPDRPVTRNEMAVVMGLLLNLNYNYYVSTCPFTDVSGVYDWARGWVGAAAANGIVSGRGDGIYDPAATVTAVEAASPPVPKTTPPPYSGWYIRLFFPYKNLPSIKCREESAKAVYILLFLC